MATALATDPELLLLDEVAAGLNPSEIEQMIEVIRWVHRDLKITVMLDRTRYGTGHEAVPASVGTGQRHLIAEGEPSDIVSDPK